MLFAQVLFLTPVRQRGSVSLKVQAFWGGGGCVGGGVNHFNPYLQFQRTQSVDGLFDQVRYLQQFRLIWKCKGIF